MLSGRLWPAHLKPQEDELLSSWLVRLARANGLKLHTFCDIAWQHKAIWNRDIDKSADDKILAILTTKTATPFERAFQTTLQAYEGRLYEKHNPSGNTKWIMPIGIYHRIRRRYGMQCCPLCLADDAEPYFRRRWRLAFVTVCELHRIMLIDRCPACSSPVIYHRCGLDVESIVICSGCGHDLRECKIRRSGSIDNIVRFQRFLLDILDKGWVDLPTVGPVYSHLYFDVLHHLTRLLAALKWTKWLCGNISHYLGEITYDVPQFQRSRYIEFLCVEDRSILNTIAGWLLSEWPDRFIWFCRKRNLLSSLLLRDMARPPYWYWIVVTESLYHPDQKVTEKEIQEASRFMERHGIPISEFSLSKMLGVSQVFRKRAMKLGDLI